jgi:O-antigen/teichoic acid export membrane protein
VVLALLALASYSNVALGFNGVTLKVLGKIRYVLTAQLVSAAIKISFSLMLIPLFGARGAAAAVTLGLISYNSFMQSGLRFAAGIKMFEMEYLPLSILIAISTGILFFLRGVLGQHISLAILSTAGASFIVLLAAKHRLSIATTFPEALRLPLVGRFLA